MSKKVAIVGSHPGTRALAPFDDPSYDIWVFNEAAANEWVKRWDCCFQIHLPNVYRSLENFIDRNHWAWLQEKRGKVIYMIDADPNVPDSVRYPYDEIVDSLPGADLEWFESSPAYALALALYMGYETIDLYGMDLTSNTEYSYQFPNYSFWVGVAKGMRVNLGLHFSFVPPGARLYGYQGAVTLEAGYFDDREALLLEKWRRADLDLRRAKNRLEQAIDKRRIEAINDLAENAVNLASAAGLLAGAAGQAQKYKTRVDPIPRQEFERAAAQAKGLAIPERAKVYYEAGKCEYLWNVLKHTGTVEAARQLREFMRARLLAAYNAGALEGAHKENLDYMLELDQRVEAAGGSRTLSALGLFTPGLEVTE